MRESIKKGRNRIGFSLFASDFDEVRKSVSAFRALQTALKAGGGQRVLSTSGRDEVSGLKKADEEGVREYQEIVSRQGRRSGRKRDIKTSRI